MYAFVYIADLTQLKGFNYSLCLLMYQGFMLCPLCSDSLSLASNMLLV